MATIAPSDLLALRARLMTAIGFTDPVEIGIVGDAAHAARGGYHISLDDIANAGKLGEYSTRLARDRNRPDPYASAMDIGDDWPIGGRAAWLRFNNNLAWELMHNPQNLPGMRELNYTPDGTTKLRYDREHPDGPTASTDTVTIHTHAAWYRDTRNDRQACLDRIVEHVFIAQGRYTAASQPQGDDGMFLRTPNGSIYLAAGGKTVSVSSTEWGSVSPQSYVSVPQSLADKLLAAPPVSEPPQVTLTPEQFSDFKASAVPIVHDAAQTGAADGVTQSLDGATIHVAPPAS